MESKVKIGTIKSKRNKRGTNLFIWIACPQCGRERFVNKSFLKRQSVVGQCHKCSIMKNGHGNAWRGGRVNAARGYKDIWVQGDNFFFPMAKNYSGGGGYVAEHRLVMAQHLGRCLHSWEIVHHKNHIRDDNRLENLQLASDIGHKQLTLLENRIKDLEFKVSEQDKEIRLLKWQQKQEVALA